MWPPRPALPSYASSSANLAHLAAERPTSELETQLEADSVDSEPPARPALVPYTSSSPSLTNAIPAVVEPITNQPATQPVSDSNPTVPSARARRWASSSDGTCDFMVAAGGTPDQPLSTPIAIRDEPLDPSTIKPTQPSPEALEPRVPIPRVSPPRIAILASSDPPTATPTPLEPLAPTKATAPTSINAAPDTSTRETPTPPAPPIPSSLQALWTTLTGDQRIRLITAWLEMAPTPQQRGIFRALLTNHMDQTTQLSFAYMTVASIEALDTTTVPFPQLPPQPHPGTPFYPQSPDLVDTTMLDVFTTSPSATATATATSDTTSTIPLGTRPYRSRSRSRSHPPYPLLSPTAPSQRYARSHPQSPPWKAYRVLGIYPSRSPFEPLRSARAELREEPEGGGYFDGGTSSTGLDLKDEAGASGVRQRKVRAEEVVDSPSRQIYEEVAAVAKAGDQNASPRKEEEWSSPGPMISLKWGEVVWGGLVWW
ncbi:hypothetical protein BU16DRAFT_544059 [Lophium mytilinum]|uniref:Uncharacterized protein n=1 Tax=Lophium mytilinum TaxID=390894 RepID=A0A6A6QCE3_9PEZI|nr:hypothetical protein BU16DRAFT_544059 [Lophium mytilinum]